MSGSGGGVSGAPTLSVIEAITQFVNGTQAAWNNVAIPIPTGLVIYATDTTAVKIGDGQTLYADLPTLFLLNAVVTSNTQFNNAVASITALTTQVNVNTAAISSLTSTVSGLNVGTLSAEIATLNADIANLALRTRLTGNTTFYVSSTTGSDAGGNGSLTTPWATLQHALTAVQVTYDLADYAVTLSCTGTFTAGAALYGALVGQNAAGCLIFDGGGTAHVTVASGTCFIANFGAAFTVQNFGLLSTSGSTASGEGSALGVNQGTIYHQGNNFGSCVNSHIDTWGSGAVIQAIGSYTISGSAPNGHLQAGDNSSIRAETAGTTVTLIGTPAFTNGFACASYGGCISYTEATFAGTSATGFRYSAVVNGMIMTGPTDAGGPNFFPGSLAGYNDGTGSYDGITPVTTQTATNTTAISTLAATLSADIANIKLRTRLTANTTFYVNASTGSDTTGTGKTAAPWATIAHGLATVQNNYDLAGNIVTLSCAGVFTTGTSLGAQLTGQSSPGGVVIDGGGTAQVNCTNSGCFYAEAGGSFTVQNFARLTTAGSTYGGNGSIIGVNQGTIWHQGNNFGSCVNAHMSAYGTGSVIEAIGSYSVSGSAPAGHVISGLLGTVMAPLPGGITITVTGTLSFPDGFVMANTGGSIYYIAATFTGGATVTGPRYILTTGGIISTAGAGVNLFPGSAAGTNDGTGSYS